MGATCCREADQTTSPTKNTSTSISKKRVGPVATYSPRVVEPSKRFDKLNIVPTETSNDDSDDQAPAEVFTSPAPPEVIATAKSPAHLEGSPLQHMVAELRDFAEADDAEEEENEEAKDGRRSTRE